MVLAYDLLEDRCTIDVKVKVLRIEIMFYVVGQKIKYKKFCRGIEQVREAGRTKIKLFLLENDPEKKYSSSISRQLSKTKPSRPRTIALPRN